MKHGLGVAVYLHRKATTETAKAGEVNVFNVEKRAYFVISLSGWGWGVVVVVVKTALPPDETLRTIALRWPSCVL